MNTKAAMALACMSMAMATPSFADETPSADGWRLFQGAPTIKYDRDNYWRLRGRLLWEVASLNETQIGGGQNDINTSQFRAARIGIEGQHGQFKYKTEIDIAGGDVEFNALNVTWKGPINIKVGQMKAGSPLEELTSSRHITFLERGQVTDAFGFDRRLGVHISKSGENYGISAGLFGNSVNGLIDDRANNRVLTTRGYFSQKTDDGKTLHLGASLRHTKNAAGAPSRSARWGFGLANERTQPEIGGNALLYGFEGAAIWGALHGHAEYIREDGDLGSADGGFVQAGYFLTGETRGYKGGSFTRTKPDRPLSKGGLGAWEIAARFDSLNARQANDDKVQTYTLGLNWYPESHLRVTINYIEANGDSFDADGLQMRLQFDW